MTHLSPRETSYPWGRQAARTAAGAGGTGLGTPALCPQGLAGLVGLLPSGYRKLPAQAPVSQGFSPQGEAEMLCLNTSRTRRLSRGAPEAG